MNTALIPSFNVEQIVNRRDKLIHHLAGYVGIEISGDTYESMSLDLIEALPKEVPRIAVFDTVRVLLGTSPTCESMKAFCWRVAGNLPRLLQERPAIPWYSQTEPEWMPVQVISHKQRYNKRGEILAEYRLRILAGSGCPLVIKHVWNMRFLRVLAQTELGFTRWKSDNPFADGSQLVRFRFLILVEPELCKGAPEFNTIYCPAGLKSWNKDVNKLRNREVTPCPNNFFHPCYRCPIGYEDCPAGTHRYSFEHRQCSRCNNKVWHDPENAFQICINCETKSNH